MDPKDGKHKLSYGVDGKGVDGRGVEDKRENFVALFFAEGIGALLPYVAALVVLAILAFFEKVAGWVRMLW